MPTLREVSKNTFTTQSGSGSHDEIRTGCLQRIADSVDGMAANWNRMASDLEREIRWRMENQAEINRLKRVIIALRGAMTKKKNRLASIERAYNITSK